MQPGSEAIARSAGAGSRFGKTLGLPASRPLAQGATGASTTRNPKIPAVHPLAPCMSV